MKYFAVTWLSLGYSWMIDVPIFSDVTAAGKG